MSYDPALATTRDLVRWLTCDTDIDNESVSDTEIDALIGLSTAGSDAVAYCVAAEVLSKLAAKWAAGNRSGVQSKQVSRLRIQYGVSGSSSAVLDDRIQHLRNRCTQLSLPKATKVFEAVGPSKCCKGTGGKVYRG